MDILKSIGVGYPKIFLIFFISKNRFTEPGTYYHDVFEFSRNNLPIRNNLDIKHLPKVSRVPREKHM